jgi:type IV pilus assembly protein PilV
MAMKEQASMSLTPTIQHGFSLIEVMVALFILAVGILGAGAMQTVGLQVTQGAYYRSQAVILASDIVDRMRANRTALASYKNLDTSTITPATAPGCWSEAAGCTPAAIATADVSRWTAAVKMLPGGVGKVTSVNANNYTVTVSWSEKEWTGVGSVRDASSPSVQFSVSI